MQNEQNTHHTRRGLTSGLVLIVLGLVFLGQGLNWPVPENWWALFILIPAAPALARAVSLLLRGSVLEAMRSLASCAVLCLVAFAFLLDLDLSKAWPVFLLFAGVSMLLPRAAKIPRA